MASSAAASAYATTEVPLSITERASIAEAYRLNLIIFHSFLFIYGINCLFTIYNGFKSKKVTQFRKKFSKNLKTRVKRYKKRRNLHLRELRRLIIA